MAATKLGALEGVLLARIQLLIVGEPLLIFIVGAVEEELLEIVRPLILQLEPSVSVAPFFAVKVHAEAAVPLIVMSALTVTVSL